MKTASKLLTLNEESSKKKSKKLKKMKVKDF